ncbi:hypothetical protein HPB50_007714 [Hyalomma asiaticum]|uniref:Uncharacterized protein n=1 Tax=Hyalomma asiaticum TaxID=266040 RepID=A0ACB7TEC8_HYAAI|nr:hypothetical protein HPB50_007714 [Hyalomma asiaticum]
MHPYRKFYDWQRDEANEGWERRRLLSGFRPKMFAGVSEAVIVEGVHSPPLLARPGQMKSRPCLTPREKRRQPSGKSIVVSALQLNWLHVASLRPQQLAVFAPQLLAPPLASLEPWVVHLCFPAAARFSFVFRCAAMGSFFVGSELPLPAMLSCHVEGTARAKECSSKAARVNLSVATLEAQHAANGPVAGRAVRSSGRSAVIKLAGRAETSKPHECIERSEEALQGHQLVRKQINIGPDRAHSGHRP